MTVPPPPLMPQAPIPFAGFWRRLAARILDGLFIGICLGIVGFFTHSIDSENGSPASFQVMTFFIFAAYDIVFLATGWQATPGKRLMGVYVIDARSGERIALPRSAFRFLLISGLTTVYGLVMIYEPTLVNIEAPFVQTEQIKLRQKHGEMLNIPDRQRLLWSKLPPGLPYLSETEQARYTTDRKQLAAQKLLPTDEENFLQAIVAAHEHPPFKTVIGVIAGFYIIFAALRVAFNRQKAGPHDTWCSTRVLKGRKQRPLSR